MPVIFIRHIGANLAFVEPLGAVDPGFGQGGGGVDPGYGLPIWLRPGHDLPGGPGHVSPPIYHPGHPDHGLPSVPARPSHPIAGHPGHPDQGLPAPPTLLPGWTLAAVRTADGKWHYASLAPGSAPPKPLPEPIPPGGAPDQGLPPQPPQPDQGLPTPPPVAGTPPVTPAPSPTRR